MPISTTASARKGQHVAIYVEGVAFHRGQRLRAASALITDNCLCRSVRRADAGVSPLSTRPGLVDTASVLQGRPRDQPQVVDRTIRHRDAPDSAGLRRIPAPIAAELKALVPESPMLSTQRLVARSSLKGGKEVLMSRSRLVLDRVQKHGRATLAGANALVTAHHALRLAMEELGVAIVFDPSSAPDLIDALGIPAADALQMAAAGATIGLVIGALAGNPAAWAGVGALIGGIGGAARGAQQVQDGWRVRAVRDARGVPIISIARGGA